MLIQILNITPVPKTTATGKPYEVLDIAFKNLSFQGKVEGKQLMPFGANAGGFNALKNAQSGQQYEVTVVKNDKGYNDWTAATVAQPGAQQGEVYQPQPAIRAGSPAPAARPNTFETPEERAKKQVYIVRQSSISAAVAALSVGSKNPPKVNEVIDYAKTLEAFVFGIPSVVEDASGFDSMNEDIPD